jgi:hypothetical protein
MMKVGSTLCSAERPPPPPVLLAGIPTPAPGTNKLQTGSFVNLYIVSFTETSGDSAVE